MVLLPTLCGCVVCILQAATCRLLGDCLRLVASTSKGFVATSMPRTAAQRGTIANIKLFLSASQAGTAQDAEAQLRALVSWPFSAYM